MSSGEGKDDHGATRGKKDEPARSGSKRSGVDASDNSGWSSENNPWGGSGDSGIHWGGGSGNGGSDGGGSSGGVNLSLFPEAQASVALGVPSTLSLVDGLWGFSLVRSSTVQSAIAKALARIKPMAAPAASMLWRGSLWGLVIEAITPTKIAPDDMSKVRHVVLTLPAKEVTKTPLSQLPSQSYALVDVRITDVVESGVQKLALTRAPAYPVSVPVIQARPTKRPGVYAASVVDGMPDIHINVGTQSPVGPQKPSEEVKDVNNAPIVQQPMFTTAAYTEDAIVVFPSGSNTSPVYISATPVLTKKQIAELQAEFKRRVAQWDAGHPVEVAERRAFEAGEALKLAQKNVNQKQATLNALKASPEGLALADASKHPISLKEAKFAAIPGYSGGGVHFETTATIENRQQLDQLMTLGALKYLNNVLQWGEVTAPTQDGVKVGNAIKAGTVETYNKLRQQLIDRQKEMNRAQVAFNTAVESRKQAEQGKKKAEDNRDKVKQNNKKPRTDFTTDGKIKEQMIDRGWTEKDIKDVVAKGPKGISVDKRGPSKTPPDFLGRNDDATVYGEPGKYVVINDRTREVAQVSDKTDPDWVDDGRIFWGGK
ncbi:colicin-like bacteriocin tRNase domain-containing protein [Cedecea sp.]|uniref:colicin-like bacteriocin tRNase domain-containing protein n=1 Tax=Cedecea sp. TaxID=1970739 RepID=UPI002F3F48FA